MQSEAWLGILCVVFQLQVENLVCGKYLLPKSKSCAFKERVLIYSWLSSRNERKTKELSHSRSIITCDEREGGPVFYCDAALAARHLCEYPEV